MSAERQRDSNQSFNKRNPSGQSDRATLIRQENHTGHRQDSRPRRRWFKPSPITQLDVSLAQRHRKRVRRRGRYFYLHPHLHSEGLNPWAIHQAVAAQLSGPDY